MCRFNCFNDFFDADKDPANGCECTKTNAGVEACDGLDNNCNGTVDEGFNFMTDVANCGGCNVTCSFPFATASCSERRLHSRARACPGSTIASRPCPAARPPA